MLNKSGFTIVELLIAIVVIGILSAIAVTASNGVQTQARNAAMLRGMDTVEKALRLYAQRNDGFPNPTELTGGGASNTYACIQPTSGGWPVQDGLAATECLAGATGITTGYSTVVQQAILTSVSKVPDTSNVTVSAGGQSARGIMYIYINPAAASLLYYIRGDQTCGRGTKMNTSPGGVALTVCIQQLTHQS